MNPFTRSTIFFISLLSAIPNIAQVRYIHSSQYSFPALITGITNNQFFAGDFDSDGDTDLVFWNGSLDHYYRNDGAGVFTLISDNTHTPFSGIRMPVFGLDNTVMQDFDSDGDLDILYFNNQVNGHTYLENTGSSFKQASNPFANFVAGHSTSSATVNQFFPGDFDADGDVDMLYSTGNATKYYKSHGNGLFTHYDDLVQSPFAAIPKEALPAMGLQYALKADFDSDGDLDIYDFNPLTGKHYFLKNNAGIFQLEPTPFPDVIDGVNGSSGTANRFQGGDFDSDGDVDLVFWTPSVNQYYRNEGNQVFRFFPNYMNTPFEGINGPSYGLHQTQLMDIDNDGDIDLLTNEGPVYSCILQNGAPPSIVSYDPAPGASNVSLNQKVNLHLSAPVHSGTGNIYFLKTTNASIVYTISASSVASSGVQTISITPPSDFSYATQYSLLIDHLAFNDAMGRALGKLDLELRRINGFTSSSFYSFTTLPKVWSDISKASPNPMRSGDHFMIYSKANEGTVRIFSMSGALMKQEAWKSGQRLSTHGLTNGIYILELITHKTKERMRLFIH